MRHLLFFLVLLSCTVAHAGAFDFAHRVVPILREHCVECHGGEEAKGGFSINTRDLVLDSGAVFPGEPDDSLLLELVQSEDPEWQMPPSDRPRLTEKQQATMVEWIEAGMPWEDGFTFADRAYTAPLRPRRVTLPGPKSAHPIDQLVGAYRRKHNLAPLEPIDDAAFLRRASLDLVGLLPTVERLDAFLDDSSTGKRARLIDELLARDVDYAEHWLTFWNDLLRNDYTGTGFITGGRRQISGWLYESLVNNKPFDQFTRELIAPPTDASRGFIDGIKWRGTVSAGQSVEIQFAQSVSQALLGINIKCASCHDSFIDQWKLDDAYGLAAIYATEPLEIHRCDQPTGRMAEAAWLFPELGHIEPDAPRPERLQQLASLVTHPENGRFARTIVNRLWGQLMGRGIVHPLDAMHTEPWSDELLDYLANQLVEHDYDLKAVLRLIATSEVYGARVRIVDQPGSEGERVFRGPRPKRMTAEQFIDSVWQLTGAAPSEFDAPILRGKVDRELASQIELSGQWIWGESAGGDQLPPGGEQLVFRKTVQLPSAVSRGALVVTADNAFEMYIGRRRVASGDDWTQLRTVPLRGELQPGDNEIVVVARNFTEQPNPAGLFVEGQCVLENGDRIQLVSDESWQVSNQAPRGGGEGRLGQMSGPWESAVSLGQPSNYMQAIGREARDRLSMNLASGGKMIRASLMKNDALMRSLGRPGRDQIVSSRPDELTMLQAINLANGEAMAAILKAGAKQRLRQAEANPDAFIRTLFRQALSRDPTDTEHQLLKEALGEEPSRQQIEDVLWSICMMPEFMIVR